MWRLLARGSIWTARSRRRGVLRAGPECCSATELRLGPRASRLLGTRLDRSRAARPVDILVPAGWSERWSRGTGASSESPGLGLAAFGAPPRLPGGHGPGPMCMLCEDIDLVTRPCRAAYHVHLDGCFVPRQGNRQLIASSCRYLGIWPSEPSHRSKVSYLSRSSGRTAYRRGIEQRRHGLMLSERRRLRRVSRYWLNSTAEPATRESISSAI